MSDPRCADLVKESFESMMDDIRQLWKAEQDGEDGVDDIGTMTEYGLSWDYVYPGTFNDQPYLYLRWQLSWGGPSQEFRFIGIYLGHGKFLCQKIEYWHLDWFDGAPYEIGRNHPDYKTLMEICTWASEGTEFDDMDAEETWNEYLERTGVDDVSD